MNMSEDSPVANDGDDKRQQHSDDDKEDGVVVGGGAVPQTLLSLVVEPVRRPAKVVWWVEGNTDQPRQNHSDDGVTAAKDCMVHVVPAHVQVTINCDECDGEQRHDTADDAEAGCRRTQPLTSTHQLLFSHHCAFNNTPTCDFFHRQK